MFDNKIVQHVWDKARIVEGYDPNIVRKDSCGAWIMKSEYGNCDNDFGWEIDHVFPRALGGDDCLVNLRPMQWENNRAKGDDYPTYNVAVQSENNANIHLSSQYSINKKLQDRLKEIYNF